MIKVHDKDIKRYQFTCFFSCLQHLELPNPMVTALFSLGHCIGNVLDDGLNKDLVNVNDNVNVIVDIHCVPNVEVNGVVNVGGNVDINGDDHGESGHLPSQPQRSRGDWD